MLPTRPIKSQTRRASAFAAHANEGSTVSVYVSTDWTFPSSLRESISKANAHPGDVHRPCPDIECEHVVWRVLGYCNRRTTCAEIDDEALSEIALPMSPQISEILL